MKPRQALLIFGWNLMMANYVDMYYAYPNVNPELLVDLGSSYVLANANFDV